VLVRLVLAMWGRIVFVEWVIWWVGLLTGIVNNPPVAVGKRVMLLLGVIDGDGE